MADLTRFWILPSPAPAAPSEASELVAVYQVESVESELTSPARSAAHRATEACLARTAAGERTAAPSPLELLDALAARHGGRAVQLLAPRAFFAVLIAHALGVEAPVELERARNLVLDWPTRNDPLLRCAFIGLDLDWSPPPPPERAARFPGGPGAAASRRQ